MTAPTPPSAPTTDQPKARQPKGLQWPVLIVCMLGANIGVCAITVYFAVTRPVQVEPNYYERAINWDASRGITDETMLAARSQDESVEETVADADHDDQDDQETETP